jgi:hypothetical protein
MSARILVSFAVVLITLFAGCQEPVQRLHAPPQGHAEMQHPMGDDITYMVDNGMLHDMSVTDIHFVPHTDFINSLGARRLNRYADLLLEIGGTIHYDTSETDEALIDARIAKVQDFLAHAGMDPAKVTVERGMSRGRTTPAREAIADKEQGTDVQSQGGLLPAP